MTPARDPKQRLGRGRGRDRGRGIGREEEEEEEEEQEGQYLSPFSMHSYSKHTKAMIFMFLNFQKLYRKFPIFLGFGEVRSDFRWLFGIKNSVLLA